MEQNLHNHIKKDKAKWIIVFIAIILIFVTSTASLVMCLRDINQSESNIETVEQPNTEFNDEDVDLQGSEQAATPMILSSSNGVAKVASSAGYSIFYEYTETFESLSDSKSTRLYDFGLSTYVADKEYDYLEYTLAFDTKGVYLPYVQCFAPRNSTGYLRIYFDSDSQYSDGCWGKIETTRSTSLTTVTFPKPANAENGTLVFSYTYYDETSHIAIYWETDGEQEILAFETSEEVEEQAAEIIGQLLRKTNGMQWSYSAQAIASSNYVNLENEIGLTHSIKLGTVANSVEFPPDPVKEGHTFTGWYWDEACTRKYRGEIITANTSLYAGWEINTFEVTFNSDGGSEVETQTVDWNTPANIITPTKLGYSFLGWYLPDGTIYENQPILTDTTLKAKWAINTYTVTFNTDGGSEIASQTVEHGKSVRLSTTIKAGYDFKGWFLPDGTQYTNQGITNNTTLKAKWEIKKLSVAFDTNGGNQIPDQVVNYGDSAQLQTPICEGYNFLGWFLSDNTEYTEQQITENTVLTAMWEVKRFTVTFFVDGTVYNEMTVDYGTRLAEAADRAEIFSQNVMSYRFTNVDLPIGELGNLVVVDDMEVTANVPNKIDRAIGAIKNNWLSILLGGVGLIAVIAVASVVVGVKKKRTNMR